jgi:hypothetical protein
LLSFATPTWLLGLLLVPVIRWLHRGGPRLRTVPVSSLALWRKAATPGPAPGARRPPDPAWRRRALLATLLSGALAGPQLAVPVERITLWVDDSISMLTREPAGTRLETGLARVAAEVRAGARADIEVRTLGNPWQAHAGLSPEVIAGLVKDAGQREPVPPPAGLRLGDRRHWLLTDGTDPELTDAEAGATYARVFRVGEATRNVGVVRLSARRSLRERDRLDVELQVRNGGDSVEERVAVLADESGVVARFPLRLEPDASVSLSAVARSSAGLRVALQPGDALEADDILALDTKPLAPRPVALDARCPEAILTALRAHPALVPAGEEAPAELALECGTGPGTAAMPRIRFTLDSVPEALDGPWTWSSGVGEAQRRRLEGLPLRAGGRLAPPADDDVQLLTVDGRPLIVRRREGGAPLIETALDAVPVGTGDRPAAPLLVAFLVDEALSASLLDAVAVIGREEQAVTIAPRADVGLAATTAGRPATQSRDGTRPLLVAVLLVLLWELAALLRRWRRERLDAEAWSR